MYVVVKTKKEAQKIIKLLGIQAEPKKFGGTWQQGWGILHNGEFLLRGLKIEHTCVVCRETYYAKERGSTGRCPHCVKKGVYKVLDPDGGRESVYVLPEEKDPRVPLMLAHAQTCQGNWNTWEYEEKHSPSDAIKTPHGWSCPCKRLWIMDIHDPTTPE